jgi:hypothetical protein
VEGLVQESRHVEGLWRDYRPKQDSGDLSFNFPDFKHVFNSEWSLWVKGLYGNPYLWVETELPTEAYEFADPDAITWQHLTPAAKKRKGSSK